jgi:hypothetical protein
MSDHFDDQLRQVLRRKEPPPGFADRVMARLPAAHPGRQPQLDRRPRFMERLGRPFAWRWLAAAAACLMMVAGIDRYQDYRRGLQAREQLLLALRITEQKLAVVESKVDELNRRSVLQ